ncbi:MAG: hypothetical protein RL768_328 [Nitrospirota bacterium]|jgi:hypothetical protein
MALPESWFIENRVMGRKNPAGIVSTLETPGYGRSDLLLLLQSANEFGDFSLFSRSDACEG